MKCDWTVVEFADNNEIRVIPSFWIQLNKKISAWPPYSIKEKILQSIEERDEPDDDWEMRNISEIFGNSGNN